jgi:hypothetical protein
MAKSIFDWYAIRAILSFARSSSAKVDDEAFDPRRQHFDVGLIGRGERSAGDGGGEPAFLTTALADDVWV